MTKKREQKICPDCGAPYNSFDVHKNGRTRRCDTTQSINRVRAVTKAAKEAGWVPVGRWHKVIEASEVPLLLVDTHVYEGGEVEEKTWVRWWVMVVAKAPGTRAYLREQVIRYLFANPKARKLFEAEFRLANDANLNREAIMSLLKNRTRVTHD